MPTVCIGAVRDAASWFRGYEQTYLERDVRDLASIGDLIPFRTFLHLVALRSGSILNISDLARDAKLSVAVASRYLSILEASFVAYRHRPFLKNRASRQIKSPKIYLADSGVAGHLAGVENIDPGAEEPMRGALLETYVGYNVASILDAHWPSAGLAFWNVQGRNEVDFVIEDRRDSMAIEIKSSSRFSDGDLSGLRAFLEHTPRCRFGILAYNGTRAVSLGSRMWAIPIAMLLA
jgi:hypothetical protein